MIYEMRTYRLKTGTLPAYLKLVEEEGIAIQKSHLGELVGYFYSEIGPSTRLSTCGLSPASTTARLAARLSPPIHAGSCSHPRSKPSSRSWRTRS